MKSRQTRMIFYLRCAAYLRLLPLRGGSSFPLAQNLRTYSGFATTMLVILRIHKVNQRAQHSVNCIIIYMCTWHAVPSCK